MKNRSIQLTKVSENFKDIDKIYKLNNEAFPAAERLPSERFLTFLERVGCDIFAVYDEDKFIGFCVVKPDTKRKIGYIFYLAVVRKYRSMGYGSATIEKLKDTYEGFQLVLDLEQPDKNSENYEQRMRRIEFYERNGFSLSGTGLSYYGVDYEIMSSNPPFREEDFRELLNEFRNSVGFKFRMYKI